VDGEDEHNPVLVSKLMQNYPNPFNPTTTIRFSIKEAAPTELSIFNLKGQLVKTLVNEPLPAGLHNVLWNGKDNNNRNVASGMYFYRLDSGNYNSVKKMLLLK
jgi:flagellar hook assembly protein FlgD